VVAKNSYKPISEMTPEEAEKARAKWRRDARRYRERRPELLERYIASLRAKMPEGKNEYEQKQKFYGSPNFKPKPRQMEIIQKLAEGAAETGWDMSNETLEKYGITREQASIYTMTPQYKQLRRIKRKQVLLDGAKQITEYVKGAYNLEEAFLCGGIESIEADD